MFKGPLNIRADVVDVQRVRKQNETGSGLCTDLNGQVSSQDGSAQNEQLGEVGAKAIRRLKQMQRRYQAMLSDRNVCIALDWWWTRVLGKQVHDALTTKDHDFLRRVALLFTAGNRDKRGNPNKEDLFLFGGEQLASVFGGDITHQNCKRVIARLKQIMALSARPFGLVFEERKHHKFAGLTKRLLVRCKPDLKRLQRDLTTASKKIRKEQLRANKKSEREAIVTGPVRAHLNHLRGDIMVEGRDGRMHSTDPASLECLRKDERHIFCQENGIAELDFAESHVRIFLGAHPSLQEKVGDDEVYSSAANRLGVTRVDLKVRCLALMGGGSPKDETDQAILDSDVIGQIIAVKFAGIKRTKTGLIPKKHRSRIALEMMRTEADIVLTAVVNALLKRPHLCLEYSLHDGFGISMPGASNEELASEVQAVARELEAHAEAAGVYRPRVKVTIPDL